MGGPDRSAGSGSSGSGRMLARGRLPVGWGRFGPMHPAENDGGAPAPALKTSPLHDRHLALGAKMAEFGGWEMPLEYPTGVLKEHAAVRESVGIFDVSHLGKATVTGPGAAAYVNATLSNDLGKIAPGKAQYTLCCDDATGGIVDDLIAYLHDDERVFLIPNAANTAEVVRRLAESAPAGVVVESQHDVVRRARRPGHPLRRGAREARAARRPRLHVVRRGVVRRQLGRRVPHRLHRRAGLRAGRAQRGRRRAVGRAARRRGRSTACCRAASAPATRSAPRWATRCTARTSASTSRPTRRGSAGRSAGRRTRSGAATCCSRRRRPVRRACCAGWSPPAGASRGRACACCSSPTYRSGQVTSGTFSPSLRKGVGLALIAAQVTDGAEVSVDVRGRREVFVVTKPPFVTPGVRES